MDKVQILEFGGYLRKVGHSLTNINHENMEGRTRISTRPYSLGPAPQA